MVSQPEYLHLVCVTLSCGELRNAAHLHRHTNAALWVLIFPPEWKLEPNLPQLLHPQMPTGAFVWFLR